jgi:putative membrane protein
MKRSAALREQEYWAVTTPEDRARIQQKISEAIRESKTRPDQFSTSYPEMAEEESKASRLGSRFRDISEDWSRRGADLGQQISRRTREWGGAAREKIRPHPGAELWKGVAAGMAAGLVGTLAMTGFMGLWNKTGELVKEESEDRAGDQQRQQRVEQEPSTEKVASDISQTIFQKKLEGDTKKAAGNAVHYGFGTAIGALYGVLTELYPAVSTGQGSLYGAAVWLGADEFALPALGYAPGIEKRPANEHLYGAAAHAIYGVVTETVRNALRNWLD